MEDAYVYKSASPAFHRFFLFLYIMRFFSTEYLFLICSVSASLPTLPYLTLCFLHFQGHRAAE